MIRDVAVVALFLSLALVVPADPDRSSSGTVAGGASSSAGEQPQDEDDPGCEEGDPGCEDFPALPMKWDFHAPKKAVLEALRKLFKDYPGEVKGGEIRKEDGEYVLRLSTLAKTMDDEDDFFDKVDEVCSKSGSDFTWGCEPDEEWAKKIEDAKAKQPDPPKKSGEKERGADEDKGGRSK